MAKLNEQVIQALKPLKLPASEVKSLLMREAFCLGVTDKAGQRHWFDRPVKLSEGFKEKRAAFIAAGADAADVDQLIQQFKALKARRALPPEEIDIDRYQTVDDLRRVVDQRSQEKSKSQVDRETKYEGAVKIAESPEWLVLTPRNPEASCLYGKGTKWCISGDEGPHHFKNYRQQLWKHYFILSKTRPPTDRFYKMAVSVKPDDTWDIRDAEDAAISKNDVQRLVPDLMPLFTKFTMDDQSLSPLEQWEMMRKSGMKFDERMRRVSPEAWHLMGRKSEVYGHWTKEFRQHNPQAGSGDVEKAWEAFWDSARQEYLDNPADKEMEEYLRYTVESKKAPAGSPLMEAAQRPVAVRERAEAIMQALLAEPVAT